MRNARTAHVLAHWKYDLNQWVVDYLQDEGYLTAGSIVERDSWSTRKRQKFANQLVDDMESAGEVKRLYSDFKTQIEEAHRVDVGNEAVISRSRLTRHRMTRQALECTRLGFALDEDGGVCSLGRPQHSLMKQNEIWLKTWWSGGSSLACPHQSVHLALCFWIFLVSFTISIVIVRLAIVSSLCPHLGAASNGKHVQSHGVLLS